MPSIEITIQLLYNSKVIQYYRGNDSKEYIINKWRKIYPKSQFDKCKIDLCEQDEYGIIPVMKASTKMML